MNTDKKKLEQMLQVLAVHLTVVDQGLRDLPVEAMKMLTKVGAEHPVNFELQERMETLTALAAKYQARFPRTPRTNVALSKPVIV